MQHIKRWLTALVLGPLLLWLILWGDSLLLAGLVATAAVFALKEYLTIIFSGTGEQVPGFVQISSYLVSILMAAAAWAGSWQSLALIPAFNVLLLSGFALSRFPADSRIFSTVSRQTLGIVYIPLALSLLIFIGRMDSGRLWILWLLIVVFANDTAAFYTGTAFGKRPLAPKISPKKTIEGSLGGMIGAMAAGFIFAQFFFHDLALSLKILPIALVLAVTGQVGDLFESALKRASRIKDSGRILPGHGGMLDRIDGLIPAIPVFYAILVCIL